MALVPVMVLDPMGRNVRGLARKNFRVFDDDQQRPIVAFGEQDAPVSVGLVYDCSRSMMQKFKVAREAPRELFNQLNPDDETSLVTISDKPELRQEFTSDFPDISNALMFTVPHGTTSLIDGVYMALQQLKHAHKPRKALIIVSDGGDNNSRYTMRELSNLATEANAQIFAICLYQNPQTPEEESGPQLLNRLARESGGVNFMIGNLKDMRRAMGDIGISLHNEYVLGYYPPINSPAGKYRKIKVQLLVPEGLPKLSIFARSGYYVPDR